MYYAVRRGWNTGVYDNYSECKTQIENFHNSVFKKFSNKEEAERFLTEKLTRHVVPISHSNTQSDGIGQKSVRENIWITTDEIEQSMTVIFGKDDERNIIKDYTRNPFPGIHTSVQLGILATFIALKTIYGHTKQTACVIIHCKSFYLYSALTNTFWQWLQDNQNIRSFSRKGCPSTKDFYTNRAYALLRDFLESHKDITFICVSDRDSEAWVL